MSNATSAEIAKARRNWKEDHLGMYLGSGGSEGHIIDVSDIGGHKFTTTLLLKYVGRKSGKTMITPLIYGDIGGEVVVVASKGGADHHPAWYLNVADSKELSFQIATQAFRATWREPKGAERAKVWDFMVGVFPPYKGYQASTAREIPLVMLSVAEPIESFKQ
ncbi:MAG: nitroreductase family deazaflavin-dependent oxidoreductase [Gammaproteobacteria bacterium]|nr:nitroreductase family deazaflavin-dependent oxidoreductase [Gammaproteobacteria bacterium]